MKWITSILVFIAGVAKACMDTVQFHFSISIFKGINDQFFDATISWQRKYSTWIPDSFTDFWHLEQFVFLNTLFIGLIAYQPIIKWNNKSNLWTKVLDFLLLRGVFGLSFVLFYQYLLIK